MIATHLQEIVNSESGLWAVSEIGSDLRDLLNHETQDVRAAETKGLVSSNSHCV